MRTDVNYYYYLCRNNSKNLREKKRDDFDSVTTIYTIIVLWLKSFRFFFILNNRGFRNKK